MVKDKLNRIDAGLARIEAATAQLGATSQSSVASAELKARHEMLVSQTAAALADLDALIAHSSPLGDH